MLTENNLPPFLQISSERYQGYSSPEISQALLQLPSCASEALLCTRTEHSVAYELLVKVNHL